MSLDSNKDNNNHVAELKRLSDNGYEVPAQGIVTRTYSVLESQYSMSSNIYA